MSKWPILCLTEEFGRCHPWPRLQFALGKPQPKASLQLAFVFAVPVLIANASKTHCARFSALRLANGNPNPTRCPVRGKEKPLLRPLSFLG